MLAQAVLEYGKAPYKPHGSARQVVWFWNEIGELAFGELPRCRSFGQAWRSVAARAQLLLSSVDAVLDPADPLPFLALHYQQVAIPGCSMRSPTPRPSSCLTCQSAGAVTFWHVHHFRLSPHHTSHTRGDLSLHHVSCDGSSGALSSWN